MHGHLIFYVLFSVSLVLGFKSRVRITPSRLRASSSGLDDVEVTKLFNRLADKYLLLDVPGAGTPGMMNCCHGGCDNCDFSRVFDEMSSGRVKWVALYPFRKHPDGREHIPPWRSMFSDDEERLEKQQFLDRLSALPCASVAMGPPSSVSPDEPPSQEACEALWSVFKSESITATDLAQALERATGAEHGAIYSEFKKALAAP